MGVLDNAGLAHLWGKVKDALSGKQNTITAGDGLSKEGDTLSVTTPVRGVVTQAEFDALPEERQNKGLYVIPDGGEGGGGSGASGGEVYSTEETRVGTWIDGKPLYRKVIQFKHSNDTVVRLDAKDLNIDSLTKMDGFFYIGTNLAFPLQWYASPTWYAYGRQLNRSTIDAKLAYGAYAANQPGIMILEYTKTTDEGGAE